MVNPGPPNHASPPGTPPQTASPRAEEATRDLVLVETIRRAAVRAGGLSDAGARAAMGELLEAHHARLFSVCLRMVGGKGINADYETASDLAQQAMLKIIQGIDGFDGRSSVATWMTRIAMNVCFSHLRSAKVRRHASLDALEDSGVHDLGLSSSIIRGIRTNPGVDGDLRGNRGKSGQKEQRRELGPEQSVQEREQRRQVISALASLDPEQRAVVVLRDVQGLEYEQIAAVLEIAVGTVKSRLFRARLALRDAFERAQAGRLG